jgi:hypothetical protein
MPSVEFSGSITRRELDAKMDSNISSGVAQLGGLHRFLPASLVFVIAHVLFVGAVIFLAALD